METALVVISWFILNIAIGTSTKWIFVFGNICVRHKGCNAFKFPLAITVLHMLFSWGMCAFYIFFVKGGLKGKPLTLEQQFYKMAPLSLSFALSVAMGNLSLKYIFPSFNQMLGSMSPLITVALAVVVQGKCYNMWTWGSMPVICGGLALCSVKEANFHLLGAFYALGATVLRAVKSIIQGKLLTGSDKLDSVTLLYYMAPWAALWLGVLTVMTEGLRPLNLLAYSLYMEPAQDIPTVTGGSHVLFLLIISGLNACLLNIANFLVTSYTSPVTLQVLGNVKSCLSIAVSVAVFRNELKGEQAVGVVICLFGVWLYQHKGGSSKPSVPLPPLPSHKVSEVELMPERCKV